MRAHRVSRRRGPKDSEKKELLDILVTHQKDRFARKGLMAPAQKKLRRMALNELRYQKGLIRRGVQKILGFLEKNPVDLIVFTGSSSTHIRYLIRMSAPNYSRDLKLPVMYAVGRSAGRVREISDFKKAYEQFCQVCPPLRQIKGKTVLVLDDVSGPKVKSLNKSKSVLEQGGARVLIGTILYASTEAAETIDIKGAPLNRGTFSYGVRRRVLTTDTGFFYKQKKSVRVRKKPTPSLAPLKQIREVLRDIASRVKKQ